MTYENGTKIFLAFKDEREQLIQGYFTLIKKDTNFIVVGNDKNELTIPWHRIIKVKEART